MLARSTYHKIPTSSNGTTVNGYLVGIVNTSDYSPFGVQLDGRTVSDGRYRYGYQGQEQDNEIKGKGNSVNYKYRMHCLSREERIGNPRVGRWLSRDPKSHLQPSQSPYKSNGNNPIIYNDPDGKQEIIRITLKNSVTGESTTFLIIAKSGEDKVAAGDFFESGGTFDGGSIIQNFYDYALDYTVVFNPEDGTVDVSYDGLTLLKENGVQATDYIWGKVYKGGTIVKLGFFESGKRTIDGGIYMTTKNGGADPTKYTSENKVDEMMSDDLLALLGGLKGGKNTDDYEKVKDFYESITKMKDLLERENSESSPSSNEIPGNDNTLFNRVYPDPSSSTGSGTERPLATPKERMNGDTLNGKPDIIFTKPEGQK